MEEKLRRIWPSQGNKEADRKKIFGRRVPTDREKEKRAKNSDVQRRRNTLFTYIHDQIHGKHKWVTKGGMIGKEWLSPRPHKELLGGRMFENGVAGRLQSERDAKKELHIEDESGPDRKEVSCPPTSNNKQEMGNWKVQTTLGVRDFFAFSKNYIRGHREAGKRKRGKRGKRFLGKMKQFESGISVLRKKTTNVEEKRGKREKKKRGEGTRGGSTKTTRLNAFGKRGRKILCTSLSFDLRQKSQWRKKGWGRQREALLQ